MTNQNLAALADTLRIHNRTADGRTEFTPDHLRVLGEFFASQDASFNRERWMSYIAEGRGQGEELIFVERKRALIAGASPADKPR